VLRSAIADRLPLGLRAGRFGMDLRSIVVIALAGVLGAALGVAYLVRSRPAQIDIPPPAVVSTPITMPPVPSGAAPGPDGSSATASGPPVAGGELVVDVEGKVRHPGIVRVPKGSRVIDAVDAAGGLLPGTDTAGLNLARLLADGEQILVGIAAPPGSTPTSGASSGMPAGPLDLNTATFEQLQELPGVGPVLAQRIVDYRTEQGRFTSVDQLREVSGIGDQRFAELKDLVRV
jgi:competence protein ComEA